MYSFDDGIFTFNDKPIIIPRIKLIEQIGSGSSGVVFRSEDTLEGREVAIKIWLPSPLTNYDKYSERFINEVNKIANLKNENIVTLYHADIIDGIFYAKMELVPGVNLRQWLKSPRDIVIRHHLLSKIYDGIKYAHDQEVYHGDLHAKNIMVIHDFDVKLLDFGTSVFQLSVEESLKREGRVLIEMAKELFLKNVNASF